MTAEHACDLAFCPQASPSVATRGGAAVLSPDYHPRPRCPVRDLYNPCVRSFVVCNIETFVFGGFGARIKCVMGVWLTLENYWQIY